MDRVIGGLIRYAPFAHQLAGPPVSRLRGSGVVRMPHLQDILDGFGKYALRGNVKINGQPAAGVRVWLFERKAPTAKRLTVSDSNGQYVFKPLRPSAEGYAVFGFDDTGAFDPEGKDFLQPVEEAT